MNLVSANLARTTERTATSRRDSCPCWTTWWRRTPTVVILLGAVGAMLSIGCANVTNLLLARGVAVAKWPSVLRSGASRPARRAIDHGAHPLLATGGVLGVLVARWVVRGTSRCCRPPAQHRKGSGSVCRSSASDGGRHCRRCSSPSGHRCMPALRSERRSANYPAGRRVPTRGRLRDPLVVGQIATTLVLLVGAAVLMRSFLAVTGPAGVRSGMASQRPMAIPRTRYPDRDVSAFDERARTRAGTSGRRRCGMIGTGSLSVAATRRRAFRMDRGVRRRISACRHALYHRGTFKALEFR